MQHEGVNLIRLKAIKELWLQYNTISATKLHQFENKYIVSLTMEAEDLYNEGDCVAQEGSLL
jgi:hypothetical protein